VEATASRGMKTGSGDCIVAGACSQPVGVSALGAGSTPYWWATGCSNRTATITGGKLASAGGRYPVTAAEGAVGGSTVVTANCLSNSTAPKTTVIADAAATCYCCARPRS